MRTTHLKRLTPILPLLLGVVLALTGSCQRGQQSPTSLSDAVEAKGEPLAENDLIWAGLSGNPPRFIDAGSEKGMGYLEIETKLIRKVLTQAGFKLRYEYFSSARVAHELSLKSPICFYPVEWSDPEKTFASMPDRIYSIPLDFKGDELLSIVIRKEDEPKFKKFIDPKGLLQLNALLKDAAFKTLLPKTEGLGPEFKDVYQPSPDGSIEINAPYNRHISTRVFRDNHQLVQMLEGGRFDYLLDTFIIQDDYKSIKSGKTPFVSLPYAANTIRTLSDPRIRLVSVVCGIHEKTVQAMPIINSIIQSIRGTDWEQRSTSLREQLEPSNGLVEMGTITSRFAAEIAAGVADAWYEKQRDYFPKLKKVSGVAPGDPVKKLKQTQVKELAWWLLSPSKDEVWLLPKADALYLGTTKRPSSVFNGAFHGPESITSEQLNAWSPDQLEFLRKALSGSVPYYEASFSELLKRVNALGVGELRSFSLLARTLKPKELQRVTPLLARSPLARLEVVFGGAEATKDVIAAIPNELEHLNLFGSILTDVQLSQVLAKLQKLKSLNIGATLLSPNEFQDSLMALPQGMIQLQAPFLWRGWTEELARNFGKKSLPKLEVFDLTENNLDDRHCSLFDALPSTLRVFKLNFNQVTSKCLEPLFHRPFPNLSVLELATLLISTRSHALLTIPPSVTKLDFAASLTDRAVDHLALPPRLDSLGLVGSYFGMKSFAKIAKHLAPQIELLDLNYTSWKTDLHFGLFKALEDAGVTKIKDLRLSHVNFTTLEIPAETTQALVKHSIKSIRVANANFRNTRLSNDLLSEISTNWGPELEAVNLGQNLISSDAVLDFLKKSPKLKSLDLSDLPDLDLQKIAPYLPSHLTALNLSASGITGPDLEALLSKLPETLTSLDLSGAVFETATNSVLGDYFSNRARNLTQLILKAPIGKIDWGKLLPSLPPTLKVLSFGPANLRAEETSAFLARMPKALDRLSLDSVRLILNSLDELTSALPRGIGSLLFFANSSLSVHNPDLSAPPLPDLLRYLKLTSETTPTLAALIPSTKPPTTQLLLENQASASLLRSVLDRRVNPFLLYLSGTVIDFPMIQNFNRMQPQTLQLLKCSFVPESLAQLNPDALRGLKILNLMGSVLTSKEIIALMKILPPHMMVVNLSSTPLKFRDVDALVNAIPKGLQILHVRGTEIGPKGYEKLQHYADRVEEETGLKLWVIY